MKPKEKYIRHLILPHKNFQHQRSSKLYGVEKKTYCNPNEEGELKCILIRSRKVSIYNISTLLILLLCFHEEEEEELPQIEYNV